MQNPRPLLRDITLVHLASNILRKFWLAVMGMALPILRPSCPAGPIAMTHKEHASATAR